MLLLSWEAGKQNGSSTLSSTWRLLYQPLTQVSMGRRDGIQCYSDLNYKLQLKHVFQVSSFQKTSDLQFQNTLPPLGGSGWAFSINKLRKKAERQNFSPTRFFWWGSFSQAFLSMRCGHVPRLGCQTIPRTNAMQKVLHDPAKTCTTSEP